MAELLLTTTFEPVSGVPEDRVTNSIVVTGPVPAAQADWVNDLVIPMSNFYNAAIGGAPADALHNYMGRSLSRATGAAVHRLYDITADLDGSPHGGPIFTFNGTLLAAGAGISLPEEVAVVLSLRGPSYAETPVEVPDGGDPGSEVDRPRQRRAGRLYLGPLLSSVIDESAGTPRPSAFFRDLVLDRAEVLVDELNTAGYIWSIWSRTDAITRAVFQVAVDDAFDTQRRRGRRASLRTVRDV